MKKTELARERNGEKQVAEMRRRILEQEKKYRKMLRKLNKMERKHKEN